MRAHLTLPPPSIYFVRTVSGVNPTRMHAMLETNQIREKSFVSKSKVFSVYISLAVCVHIVSGVQLTRVHGVLDTDRQRWSAMSTMLSRGRRAAVATTSILCVYCVSGTLPWLTSYRNIRMQYAKGVSCKICTAFYVLWRAALLPL